MKKTMLCLLIASTMLVACNQKPKEFKTYSYEDKRCFIVTCDEEFLPGGDDLAVENSLSLQWPARGFFPPCAPSATAPPPPSAKPPTVG